MLPIEVQTAKSAEKLSTPSKVIATLAGNPLREPWFMFLHLWELHWPRKAKGQFASPRYGKQLYQRSVAYLDSQLPRILDAVDPSTTIVAMTGDHGEGIAGAIDDPRPWVQMAVSAGYKLTRSLPPTMKKGILSAGKRAVLEEKNRSEVAGHAQLCVYDYLIRVPFVVSAPGLLPEGKRLEMAVPEAPATRFSFEVPARVASASSSTAEPVATARAMAAR